MPSHASFRSVLIAAIGGASLATLLVAPSAANASGNTCVSGDVCYYNNANFATTGSADAVDPWSAVSNNYYDLDGSTDPNNKLRPAPHTYNNPDWCNTGGSGAPKCDENDTISSVRNKTTKRLRLYNDAFYRGSYQTMDPGTSLAQVRNNDQISSFCLSGVGSCPF